MDHLQNKQNIYLDYKKEDVHKRMDWVSKKFGKFQGININLA